MNIAHTPNGYIFVRVHVTAKGFHEAANKALDALDFVRGTWNFGLNYNQWRRRWGGRDRPLNEVVLGPIHSLHYPSGKLAATDEWWYQPEYNGVVPAYTNPRGIDDFYELLQAARNSLHEHAYADLVTEGLLRYTRALDEPRAYVAFRKLWSVLELLTHSKRDRIERATYLLKDREYHRFVLQQLTSHRNELVHADKENIEMSTYLLHLKGYVETLLNFHIRNKYQFKSIEEAGMFLSQPREPQALKKRVRLAEIALALFGED